jgi:hypothetical protein
MENFRGVCTACGLAHDGTHVCSSAFVRLMEIDREAGSRTVREALIALNQKGFNNKIETLEAEAAALRLQL